MAGTQYENLTRRKLRFPKYEMVDGTLVVDHKKDFVLGDAADRDLEEGQTRGPKNPSPIATLTDAERKAMDPRQLAALDALVKRGDVRATQVR